MANSLQYFNPTPGSHGSSQGIAKNSLVMLLVLMISVGVGYFIWASRRTVVVQDRAQAQTQPAPAPPVAEQSATTLAVKKAKEDSVKQALQIQLTQAKVEELAGQVKKLQSEVAAQSVPKPRQTAAVRNVNTKTQKPTERRKILAAAVSAEDSKLLLAYPARKQRQ